MNPEPLDYSPAPAPERLGRRWIAPLGMNCVSAGLGVLVAVVAWQNAGDRFFPPAWLFFGGPVMLLQIVLLALSLILTLDTRQPRWTRTIRQTVLWTAPAGLILALGALLLDFAV
ncbi:MAG TPA: hypothetical protein VFB66_14035 [Tepidisphaeraceae bacterium]|nr:hypothetical protein [Tepidisphaeraceae bacterium]